MDNICLESVWQTRLQQLGWSDRAATQTVLHWASSTIQLYNRQVVKFRNFCDKSCVCFPPKPEQSSLFADFMCSVADSSVRPESVLRSTSAALSGFYHGLGQHSPMDNSDIQKLISALTKTGTKLPARRTPIMPCAPFMTLFQGWPDNEALSIKDLRLKTVTLMALNFMTRPSDLAPKGVLFNPETFETLHIDLSVKQLLFNDDSVIVLFFGIKNDSARTGFEVRIAAAQDNKIDMVAALKCYVSRTAHVRSTILGEPLFISLRPPYRAIRVGTISQILSDAISLAGLGGLGFTPKSFRPSAATAAVQANVKPETAMQIGRWKTEKVFRDRYVYPLTDKDYSDKMLQFKGLNTV